MCPALQGDSPACCCPAAVRSCLRTASTGAQAGAGAAPVMTRAKLLAFLHRLSLPLLLLLPQARAQAHRHRHRHRHRGGVSQPESSRTSWAMLALEDVRGDAITDPRVLLEDKVPPRLFMRTSIISSQKHSDVCLCSQRGCADPRAAKAVGQPVLWQGVCHAVVAGGAQNAEPSLRAILGLPGAIKGDDGGEEAAAQVSAVALSQGEEEVVSGKWAGLEAENRAKGGRSRRRSCCWSLRRPRGLSCVHMCVSLCRAVQLLSRICRCRLCGSCAPSVHELEKLA